MHKKVISLSSVLGSRNKASLKWRFRSFVNSIFFWPILYQIHSLRTSNDMEYAGKSAILVVIDELKRGKFVGRPNNYPELKNYNDGCCFSRPLFDLPARIVDKILDKLVKKKEITAEEKTMFNNWYY